MKINYFISTKYYFLLYSKIKSEKVKKVNKHNIKIKLVKIFMINVKKKINI